jgi:hypothetical protein
VQTAWLQATTLLMRLNGGLSLRCGGEYLEASVETAWLQATTLLLATGDRSCFG